MTSNGSSYPEELSSDADSGLDGPSQASGGVHAAGASQESSRKKSDVWKHFTKAADYETSKKAICIHCKSSYVCSGGSTRSLWRHVKKAHPKALDTPVAVGPLDRFLGEASEDVPYSNESFKEILVDIIARKCLPFVLVEDRGFRKMVRMLRPGTTVPSANTIKNTTMKIFNAEKARMRALLQEAPGKLSFTADVWTSANMEPFLGVTVHWIDKEWCLQDMLLDLVPLEGSHTGESLCAAFVDVCLDFGILTKLLAVTTDNASNNITFVAELESVCQERGIPFTEADNHVRCMAHVIHLAVQEFLKKLQVEAPDTRDDRASAGDSDTSCAHCISRLRKLVVKIRLSSQRRERFAHTCKLLHTAEKELVVDVRTRWDSTFLMIERALELRKPLDTFAACERDLRVHQLADEEWSLLEIVRDLLWVFRRETEHLCASTYPTFTTAIPVYNCIMDGIEDFVEAHSGSKAIVEAAEAAKEKIKEYYAKGDATVYPVATVLDPRFKLEYHRVHDWEPEWVDLAKDSMERVLSMYPMPVAQNAPTNDRGEPKCTPAERMMAKRPRIDPPDELHSYLTSPLAVAKVDVLQWWKTNGVAYPRLSEVARDYLAVPATGAPIERVFSGGTDMVSPKRGCLAPGTIRASLCLKSWLRFPK
jgi:hypothetical protein